LEKARKHLESLKSQYYAEIKAGSRLAPEQQKAVEFFNRYNKENEETNQVVEQQTKAFLQKTDQVFSEDFKGFDYQVGEKKYRFNVKNAADVKNSQSDINNFIKKFLNDKNEMSDAKGYHKSLFTAMNADAVAQHFYEQGKADAIKDSTSRAKNIEMGVRGVHQDVKSTSGFQVRSVDSDSGPSKLKIKTFRNA
jgi:predicted PolB exonuclease-like 3'-5' exonuclease